MLPPSDNLAPSVLPSLSRCTISIVTEMASQDQQITLTTRGKFAVITLNLPEKLNALTLDLCYHLSTLLRKVAARDDIYITVLTGKGRFFSACVASLLVPPELCDVPIANSFMWNQLTDTSCAVALMSRRRAPSLPVLTYAGTG